MKLFNALILTAVIVAVFMGSIAFVVWLLIWEIPKNIVNQFRKEHHGTSK